MREQLEPIGTLRDQVEHRHWIWLHCTCGRGTKHDPAELADRLGADMPLARLVRASRCCACGARGAMLTIQPPYYKDGSDATPRRT
jgi:hypothetical protein